MSKKCKILIVDDEVDIVEMLAEFFADENFEVTSAISGNDAIKLVEKVVYNIVLSDYRMPNGTGLDLLNKINALEKDRRPKFFFMTGFADMKEEEAIALGALRFFRKPFKVKEVVQDIVSFC